MKKIYLFTIAVLVLNINVAFSQGSGRAIQLNGTSAYLSCNSLNLTGTALTLQCWVKVDAFKTSNPFISSLIGIEQTSGQAMIRLGDAGLAAEKVQFVLRIGGIPQKLNGVTTLSANKWHHVAATYDGATMKIYIDGVLDASRSQTGSITGSGLFEIGRSYNNTRFLDGEIDEISVFKAALSQTTIRDYMCQSISSTHPNYSSIDAYWKSDLTTASLTDNSGNFNTASYQGSPSPVKVTSSAPIGDVSVHNYNSPASIYLSHANGDSLVLSNLSGSPQSVHLYLVNKKSNSTSFPASVSAVDTTRYWGVFYTGGLNPRANVTYFYQKNLFYKSNSSCFIDLVERANNSIPNWSLTGASQTTTSLSLTSQQAAEYQLTFATNKKIHNDTLKGVCIGDTVQLMNSSTGYDFLWHKNGVALMNDTLNALKVHEAATYFLEITFNTCKDTTNSFTLTVAPKPTVSLAALKSVCFGNGVIDTLKGGLPLGGAFVNPYISGNLFLTGLANVGTHKIVYKYTAPSGCSDTASQLLTVLPQPTVNLTSFSPICEDSTSFLLNNGTPSGGVYTVDGITATSFDPKNSGVGNYAIVYAYTNTNNCSNTASQNIQVIPLPNVTFKLPKNTACEESDPFIFNGNNPTGGVFSGTGVSGFNFSPILSGVGTFPVLYQYTDNTTGCSNSATDTVFIKALPPAPTIVQNGLELNTSIADGYQWYDKDGLIFGETKQIYKPLKSGNYRLIITKDGCVSKISEEFYFDKTLSNREILSSKVNVYPNPTNHFINITGELISNIKIVDLSGKLIIQSLVTNERKNTVNLNQLESGVYFLSIGFKDGTKLRKPIIKQ